MWSDRFYRFIALVVDLVTLGGRLWPALSDWWLQKKTLRRLERRRVRNKRNNSKSRSSLQRKKRRKRKNP